MRATMHCAFGDTTITTRRLNKTTWQFESQTVVKQSQAGRGDAVSPMRAMLEAMMEKGSPEEKREAAAQLANLPKMEAQMAGVQRQRAAMAPQMAQARSGRGRTRRLLRQRQAGVGERRQIHDHPDRRQVRRLMPRARPPAPRNRMKPYLCAALAGMTLLSACSKHDNAGAPDAASADPALAASYRAALVAQLA
ncbi:hypothetical protein LP419_11160 [Massilia sp. H-1]|nr:hypothetical protein LP419_11160 [Massilia sp. H-1]